MSRDLFTVQNLAFDDEFRALALRSATPNLRRLAEEIDRMSPSRRKRLGHKARRKAHAYLTASAGPATSPIASPPMRGDETLMGLERPFYGSEA